METDDKPEPEKEPEVDENDDAEDAEVVSQVAPYFNASNFKIKQDELTKQAQTFLGVSKDTTRSAEEAISTPLPGETLAMFYARSREYWAQKAHENSDNRGKLLRRDGFALAEERYGQSLHTNNSDTILNIVNTITETYRPVLKEVERILEEAGLDAEEIKRVGTGGGTSSGSRNRR
ncbi:hypothetical protein AG1IA_04379 [Rhizoctonia solani AG-1 IA]|uniref:DUF4110 domain-containing protein n=1 Tax=Thanatephorus cucumeris (strain AG1-IA) TaxID=983506 RepID=L8WXN9_THACA|nr:hypothetical protein AG1IA_04379 [Rhizoctonia solani AG-1 IA]